ncbi:hypothetical protein M3Y98_00050900 [Aphelenchoides besseyi]|nr:hypothetical protein M3Y98_00050900 [Aphelenchoides besseyi]KAI6198939.1 hypothetical protein M3Y96_00573700 [Aphelenchoides besseyi]
MSVDPRIKWISRVASSISKSMSVDSEIVRVRDAIKRVHSTIIGLTGGIQNITENIDHRLDGFTSEIRGVQDDVSNVKMGVSHISDKFPNRALYLGILLAVDLFIWMLAAYLLYRIIQNCRYGVKNSDRIIAEYEQLIYHPELMDIHVHLAKNPRVPTSAPSAVVVDRQGRSIPLNVLPQRYNKQQTVFSNEFASPSEEPLLYNSPDEGWLR